MQQIAKGQRGQRITTEFCERHVGRHVGSGGAEKRAGCPAHGFQGRPVRTVLAQRTQHVGLAVGQVGVELLESRAVVLLELGAGQLSDAGQQSVLQA